MSDGCTCGTRHYTKNCEAKMGLIKEPKHIDLSTKSEPWTEKELVDFRKIMQDIKAKNAKREERKLRQQKQMQQTSKQ